MAINVQIAIKKHKKYATTIAEMIEVAALRKENSIALRKPEYILDKIIKGKSIIALDQNIVVGFCYFETWGDFEFISNSGLIVNEKYRGRGFSKEIKKQIFKLSRKKFPNAKLFGLTTSPAVMKINHELGYEIVTYNKLTKDETFWAGCKTCSNYETLLNSGRENCKCTGMLMDPNKT